MKNKLTTKEYWIHPDDNFIFSRHIHHGIDEFIKKHIPVNKGGSCLEVGSYPGTHLPTFGDLGYILNGIDFHPDNCTGLPAWLESEHYKTGHFICEDFFEYETDERFDVVASFGFVEHFENYEEVMLKHIKLVLNGGYIIITTPNFKGWIQYGLHNFFDKTNLMMHNTKSMNPYQWKYLLEENGFEVKYYGFFGGFWFWRGKEKLPGWKKRLLWIAERAVPRIRKIIKFQSSSFSAYAGIVAKKI